MHEPAGFSPEPVREEEALPCTVLTPFLQCQPELMRGVSTFQDGVRQLRQTED